MNTPQANHRTAFTLIEVLVVIAMIGVLLGVLIVSLSTVQDSAKTASDLSNQSQIVQSQHQPCHRSQGATAPSANRRR